MDKSGFKNSYQALSLSEYRGILKSRGESMGYYICDVRDISANFWYRRINNSSSILLKEKDVSKQGYVRKNKEYNYT